MGHGIVAKEVSASNLYGFASRAWLTGLLDPKQIVTSAYFGATEHKEGEMVGYITGEEFPKISAADREKIVIALSAQAQLESQKAADEKDAAAIAAGATLIKNAELCAQCHRFDGEGELGTAPDLTGYGSREWVVGMISDSNHERFYKDRNDRMPAFAESDNPANNRLSRKDVELLADWLRGDWYEPRAASDE
jgi:ubiquinol-cytochrome c reductase cytochrome b subunit